LVLGELKVLFLTLRRTSWWKAWKFL